VETASSSELTLYSSKYEMLWLPARSEGRKAAQNEFSRPKWGSRKGVAVT
jgi:hypothetical protein